MHTVCFDEMARLLLPEKFTVCFHLTSSYEFVLVSMDPLTALSLASNVIQFVEFGLEIVSTARGVAKHPLKECRRLTYLYK